MKITILGTGSTFSKLNSASYLIDNDILIDMPNGNCKNLKRRNIDSNNISHILITHFHGDHYFDIPFYLLKKKRYCKENNNINFYVENEEIKKIKDLTTLAFPNSVNNIYQELNIKFETSGEFKINNYNIKKLEVKHGRMIPSFGYLFSKENIKVGFTGDTSLCENVIYMASVCNYLICDCTFKKGTGSHMGIDIIKDLASKYKNCRFVLSHMDDDVKEIMKKERINNIIVPNDGDIIEIEEII